jgi:hypothetical protein
MNAKMIYTDLLKPTTPVNEQQLDEISWDQVGNAAAGVLGGIGKTAGAVAGVPQGLGRAIKKGYRGAVKGIGGEDDAGSLVPGSAYGDTSGAKAGGKAEMPIGSNTINPRTGKPYVPSDFSGPSGGSATATPAPAASGGGGGAAATRDADTVKTELRNLDAAYKTRRNALNKELEALSSAPAGGAGTEPAAEPATGALGSAIAGTPAGDKPETVSIGGQKISPSDPLYATIAASQVMQNKPLVQSIQALDAKQLEIVKQILSKKAAGALEERLPAPAAPVVPTKSRMSRAYDLTKRGLAATGNVIAATPRALSTAAGATRGAFTGMSQAYSKGKQAGTKYVGRGQLSWDDIQVELANLSVEDAKALLSFVNQLGVTAAEPAPAPGAAPASAPRPPKSDAEIAKHLAGLPDERFAKVAARTDLDPRIKAIVDAETAKRASSPPAPAPADAPGSGAAGKVPGYTGRETDIAKIKAAADAAKAKPGFDRTAADLIAIKNAAAAGITEAKGNKKLKKKIVAETLTWSKNFDPSRHLIKQIRRT